MKIEMPQIISKFKDDLQVFSQLSCFADLNILTYQIFYRFLELPSVGEGIMELMKSDKSQVCYFLL